MTRFEKAKLLGYRATMIERGDTPRTPITDNDTIFTVAEREFDTGKLYDLTIDRVFPDGSIKSIPAADLAFVE